MGHRRIRSPHATGQVRPRGDLAARETVTATEAERWHQESRYSPNFAHKKSPRAGRPPAATLDKTDCDEAPIRCPREAGQLLRLAFQRRMVSSQRRGQNPGWPQTVWAVDGSGMVYEAQLTNQATGEYHGYPVMRSDHFYDYLKTEWERRG